MRILFTHKVSPKLLGGAETRIREIGKRLVLKGHEVIVVCAKTEPGLPDYELIDGMHTYYVKTVPGWLFRFSKPSYYLSMVLFYILSYWKIKKVVKEYQPNLLHDDISPYPCLAAIRIAHEFDIPLVGTVHNIGGTWKTWKQFYGLIGGTVGYVIEHSLIRTSRSPYIRLICVAEWMRDSLLSSLQSERVVWVPNAVDSTQFSPSPHPYEGELDWGNGQVHLVYAARFASMKGMDLLLHALAQLPVDQVDLHLAGDGALLEEMRQLAIKLSVADRIVFHGRLSKYELIDLFRQSNIFVFPSLSEGSPMALLEAMSCELPVVAFKIPGVEGIVNERSAILVPVADYEQLALAIKQLVDTPTMRVELGYQARKQVLERFDWEFVVEQLLQVYQQIRVSI